MVTAREKLKSRIDKLEGIMQSNEYLNNPLEAMQLINKLSNYWGVMAEEDREFIQAAQMAIEDKLVWNLRP
mgnify:FL=1|jgi:hypothetical protein